MKEEKKKEGGKVKQNPKPFEKGVCFICKKPIIEYPDAYAHYDCALSMSDEKAKRLKEAKENV